MLTVIELEEKPEAIAGVGTHLQANLTALKKKIEAFEKVGTIQLNGERTRVRCCAPSRNTSGRLHTPDHLVRCQTLVPTGEGAGRHTRGACAPQKITESFRQRRSRVQLATGERARERTLASPLLRTDPSPTSLRCCFCGKVWISCAEPDDQSA